MRLVNNYTTKYLIPCTYSNGSCTAAVVVVEPKKWSEYLQSAKELQAKYLEDFGCISFEVEAYFIDNDGYANCSWVEATENELESMLSNYNRVTITELVIGSGIDVGSFFYYIKGCYKFLDGDAITINFDFEKLLNEANQTI